MVPKTPARYSPSGARGQLLRRAICALVRFASVESDRPATEVVPFRASVVTTDYSNDLELAIELADMADTIARARFGASDLIVDQKPNGSPVTDADRSIEAAVTEHLRRIRPGMPIFGEERGPAYDREPTYWTIDPIDGTAAFIAGNPGWGFTACLVENFEPVAGIASSVGLGRRWWASRERGAFASDLPVGTPETLQVSTTTKPVNARIGVWDGNAATFARSSHGLDVLEATLRPAVGSISRTGSAALDVASGRLDAAIMWANSDAPWDQAVFSLLVREAGGTTTDLARSDQGGGCFVLLSNGRVHETVLALFSQRRS